MDMPAAVPTAPVAARRTGPRRVAIVAAVIVGLTIVRPWDGVAGATPVAPARVPDARDLAAAVVPIVTPSPSPEPSLLPDEIACNPGGWTLVSLDRLGPWTVRSWVPAHPVHAEGPLDPRIGRLALESPEVLAIGACTPSVLDDAGATVAGGSAGIVGAWRVEAGQATTVDLGIRRSAQPRTAATLYQPKGAVATAATPAHWPGGTYILQLGADEHGNAASGGSWYVGVVVRSPD